MFVTLFIIYLFYLFVILVCILFSLVPFSFSCGSGVYWMMGVDNGNIGFLLLIVILFPLLYWIAGVESNTINLFLVFSGLLVLLLVCFMFVSLLLFFMSFESMVIILFLILFLFIPSFYSMSTAFILFVFSTFGSMAFIVAALFFILSNWWVSSIFILIPFLIKVPSFPLFYWLPEVHCEASSSMSLLLAGLLLKLGVFGMLSFILSSFFLSLRFLSCFVLSLSLIGVILASSSCFRYFDTKKMIAFSSIMHLNLSFGSIVCMNGMSVLCGMLTSMAHAFCSSGMFLIAGLMINKTYSSYLDSLYFIDWMTRFMLFLFMLGNLSFATSLNFIGEILSLIGLFSIDSMWLMFFSYNCFLSTFFWFLVLNMKLSNYYWYFFLNYIEILALLYLLFLNFFCGIGFIMLSNSVMFIGCSILHSAPRILFIFLCLIYVILFILYWFFVVTIEVALSVLSMFSSLYQKHFSLYLVYKF